MQLFKFEPILKQTIWGGERIIPFKGLDVSLDNVGESWELSGVPGDESIVAEGPHKGMSLPRLIGEYKEEIVG
ncbi:MAG TPA: mannose-6-phosphate isomerase, partial [Bacteroidaceae bacterium]|nr:mannose-6-phosphate isomerase [Bacteroidaceae bacterium]